MMFVFFSGKSVKIYLHFKILLRKLNEIFPAKKHRIKEYIKSHCFVKLVLYISCYPKVWLTPT